MGILSGAVTGAIASAAAKVGAEMVGKAVGGLFGPRGGELAETVVDGIAEKLGVPAGGIPAVADKDLEGAVAEVEQDMPEMIALWAKGLDGQFSLLQAETKEGFWQSAWRWGWMYLLAVVWLWNWLLGPLFNHFASAPIALPDNASLLTVTGWFMALYMGGHTIKALGEQAVSAVKTWKDKP